VAGEMGGGWTVLVRIGSTTSVAAAAAADAKV